MTSIRLLRSLLAAVRGAVFPFAGANAAAPQVKTQASSFYRMR